jgi:hypothetical protein
MFAYIPGKRKSKASINTYNLDNNTHVVYEEITTIRPSQHTVCKEAVYKEHTE